MRRWGILLSALAGLSLLSAPPAQGAMTTSEWTAIQYLNHHRVAAGLSKLRHNSCLERAAEVAAEAGLRENGAGTYLSIAELTAIKKRCGFERLSQLGCGCLTPWAGSVVSSWAASPISRNKWGVPTHTSIGIARIPGGPGQETIWHALIGTPVQDVVVP